MIAAPSASVPVEIRIKGTKPLPYIDRLVDKKTNQPIIAPPNGPRIKFSTTQPACVLPNIPCSRPPPTNMLLVVPSPSLKQDDLHLPMHEKKLSDAIQTAGTGLGEHSECFNRGILRRQRIVKK